MSGESSNIRKIFNNLNFLFACKQFNMFIVQVQPCSWREQSAKVKRRRRSVGSEGSQGNITSVAEEPADLDNSEGNKNSSFSESLRLFQSIQVLANEEESAALRNETAESEWE